jgi:type II secretory pathway component PulF
VANTETRAQAVARLQRVVPQTPTMGAQHVATSLLLLRTVISTLYKVSDLPQPLTEEAIDLAGLLEDLVEASPLRSLHLYVDEGSTLVDAMRTVTGLIDRYVADMLKESEVARALRDACK